MEEEEERQKLSYMVKELVHRLLSQNFPSNSLPLNPNFPKFHNSLCYALCLATHVCSTISLMSVGLGFVQRSANIQKLKINIINN